MRITLFDYAPLREQLLPLTYTRPVADIRVGILTIAEKWASYGSEPVAIHTQDYLQGAWPTPADSGLWVNGAICPDMKLWDAIKALEPGESLAHGDMPIAVHKQAGEEREIDALFEEGAMLYPSTVTIIERPWHIFKHNGVQIKKDMALVCANRESQPFKDPFTRVYAPENVFIEEGASIKAAIINAEAGPVYIGKDAHIHEGAIITGPFALCEGAHINPGSKMRGDTTIGPYSKVGGEISNSVVFGYSNKGHEGFMGNSVLGTWCNLGADTNTSNLKNNYSDVRVWSYAEQAMVDTGEQFCGLIMGDHSKCSINTMFNTGTVVGVAANIFGSGFPPKHIPSFVWGGAEGFETHALDKALDTARRVMERRKVDLDEQAEAVLAHLHKRTGEQRKS